jgi:transcriptional regulator with XRE-family HTH domain
LKYEKAIKVVRAARGLSQRTLAERTGLSANYISLLESGNRAPSMDALKLIAKATGVPVYLLVLLGSEAEELDGVSPEAAGVLGQKLLEMVMGVDGSDQDY